MRRAIIAVAVLLITVSAWAQQQQQGVSRGPLKAELKAWVVRTDTVDGKPVVRKLPADSAAVGDTIEYELHYTNVGDLPISGLKPTAKIPEGTVYLEGSASSSVKARLYFSIDGGKTYHELPIYYKVKLPDGREVKKEATPDMFTHIRWGMEGELLPGRSAVFSYRVIVK